MFIVLATDSDSNGAATVLKIEDPTMSPPTTAAPGHPSHTHTSTQFIPHTLTQAHKPPLTHLHMFSSHPSHTHTSTETTPHTLTWALKSPLTQTLQPPLTHSHKHSIHPSHTHINTPATTPVTPHTNTPVTPHTLTQAFFPCLLLP